MKPRTLVLMLTVETDERLEMIKHATIVRLETVGATVLEADLTERPRVDVIKSKVAAKPKRAKR